MNVNNQKIINVASPISNNDATNKSYVDTAISGLSTVYQTIANMTNYYTKTQADARYYLNTTPLNSLTAPTGSLSINSQKVINVLDPTSD